MKWPWHRHHWKAVAVRHGTFTLVKGDGTAVLQRCECGRTRTATMNGHWTLEQLTGESK